MVGSTKASSAREVYELVEREPLEATVAQVGHAQVECADGAARGRPSRFDRLSGGVMLQAKNAARAVRHHLRPRYQRQGVGEYWIVDGESETIERGQPADERPAILADALIWHPRGASEPFVLDIPALFRNAEPR